MKSPTTIRSLLFFFALAVTTPLVMILAYSLYSESSIHGAVVSDQAIVNGILLLVTIFIVAALARWYSNRIERPLSLLLQATSAVTKGDLSTRVSIQGPSELAELALQFNAMVDARERSHHELRTTEEQYRTLVEQLPAVLYRAELDGDNRLLFISSGIQQLVGFSASEWMQTPGLWLERLVPEDRQAVQSAIEYSRATNEPFVAEYRLRSRDGNTVWVRDEAHVLLATDEHPRLLQGIMVDLTAQKSAETRLMYQGHLLNQVHDAIIATDTQRIVKAWNRAAESMYGWTAEEALEHPVTDVLYSEITPETRQELHRVLGEMGETRAQLKQYRKTGEPLWVESTTMSLRNECGDVTGFVSVNRDITQQRRFERQLQQRTAHAEALASTAASLNARLDLDDVVQAVGLETAQALKAPVALVFLYDTNLSAFQLAAAHGLSAECTEQLKKQPFLYPDSSGRAPAPYSRNAIPLTFWSNAGVGEMPNLTGVLMVPIQHEEQVLGLICAATTNKPRTFSPDECQLLNGIAAQAVLAISNARLFGQVRAGRQRMQVLSRRLVELQESERQAIARELHDEIGQSLTGLGLVLEMASHTAHNGASANIGEAQNIVSQLMKQVRNLSLDLRPAMLDDLGLSPALTWLVNRFASQTGIEVDMKLMGLEGKRFPNTVETAAYRIVQEALTNIARHARVDHAQVRVWTDDDAVSLMVVDEGVGFPAETLIGKNQSSGLIGMRERAMLLGGQFVLESNPGEGTRVNAKLPLQGFTERRDRERMK